MIYAQIEDTSTTTSISIKGKSIIQKNIMPQISYQPILPLILKSCVIASAFSFVPLYQDVTPLHHRGTTLINPSLSTTTTILSSSSNNNNNKNNNESPLLLEPSNIFKMLTTFSLSISILLGVAGGAGADTAASVSKKYDGFADYAKENQMEKSDVGCFINKCGDQTKNVSSLLSLLLYIII